MKRYLVTGGAGFIGSNFIRYIHQNNPDISIINLDALTYAGKLENLSDIEEGDRYQFIKGRIENVHKLDIGPIDIIVHFAAESHVDRSIEDSRVFIETNVVGTQALLALAKERNIEKFIHVSTDEVYGELGETGAFTEETPLSPNSPYSASKAGSDMLALSYYRTHGLPVCVTRCSNNYGPYQFPEKLIPLMLLNALKDKSLPVYGAGENIRDWIYVDDHVRAVECVIDKGKAGEVYNIGGETEIKNIDLVKRLLKHLDKPESLIKFVTDRLGHDFRYAIDCTKIKTELGWTPKVSFDDGLEKTIEWYKRQH